MGWVTALLLGCCTLGALGFLPVKDNLVGEAMLREVVERMGRDLDSYLEEVAAPYPRAAPSDQYTDRFSIRDQEYLQHSSLWNSRYNQDVSEEDIRLKPDETPKGKTKDNTLPAYCNPPNPCPVGFTAKDGCLEEFENTAAFSREYQAEQECMCDTEHMFECSTSQEPPPEINQIDRFVQQFQRVNPYLLGDKLPIAAKKGHNIYY